MSPARVDVLVTVYNGEAHLREALDSLTRQTLRDIVVHVVDDGSNDGTAAILEEAAHQDARIRYYRKSNGGVVESSNYGLRFCTSDYVARLDADDISLPDRLERQVRLLELNPSIVAESGAAYKIDLQGRRVGVRSYSSAPEQADAAAVPAKEPYLLHPFVILRRAALEHVGGYRDLSVSEDSDLFWRLSEIGELRASQDFYGEYRMNPASLSSKSTKHGRVMAAYSQLAALSSRRRSEHREDFSFDRVLAGRIARASETLEGLVAELSPDLTPQEKRWFSVSIGMKLVEMADYRPYELSIDDCTFVRDHVRPALSAGELPNARFIRRSCAGTAARIASSGLHREAKALLFPAITSEFVLRLLARTLVPSGLFQKLKDVAEEVSKARERRNLVSVAEG